MSEVITTKAGMFYIKERSHPSNIKKNTLPVPYSASPQINWFIALSFGVPMFTIAMLAVVCFVRSERGYQVVNGLIEAVKAVL